MHNNSRFNLIIGSTTNAHLVLPRTSQTCNLPVFIFCECSCCSWL